MIDSVAPALASARRCRPNYPHTASVQVSFTASDALSGLTAVAADLDGVAVTNGQTIQLLTLSLGTHILTVSASDARATRPRPVSGLPSSRPSTR